MKKQIILVAMLLSGICYAQKTKFAVKGGLNISNTKFSVIIDGVSSTRDYDSRKSYYVGGSVEFLLRSESNKTNSIQVELLYAKQGHDYNHYRTSLFELEQINLPIVFKKIST